jgi:hypothetical protein
MPALLLALLRGLWSLGTATAEAAFAFSATGIAATACVVAATTTGITATAAATTVAGRFRPGLLGVALLALLFGGGVLAIGFAVQAVAGGQGDFQFVEFVPLGFAALPVRNGEQFLQTAAGGDGRR